ncbi:MAG: hypothetical protein ACK5MP_00150 [Nostocoides sp.]
MTTPSTEVSPGLLGFFVFFILAVVLWLLMRNMNSRMRRMSYRQRDAHRTDRQAQATEEDLLEHANDGEVDDAPSTSGSTPSDDPTSDAGDSD